jgi:CO/xanthine dehydrogenase Mo-binding subunit
MEEYSVVGKSIPNRDSVEKAKGSAIFTDDIKLKGMLHGKILRSPLPHAKIGNIDISKAHRLKGVKAIVTAEDTLQKKFSISPTWADKLVLENQKVRYVGDEIAAVAAVDEDTAQEALDLIQVDFEELQGVFDPVEAMKPGAPIIHDSVENNISKVIRLECGDIEAGFAGADLILEETFSTQAQAHCSL